MRLKIQQMIVAEWFPFVILFAFMLLYHFMIQGPINDDLFYQKVLHDFTYYEYLHGQWYVWTSRMAVEAVIITVSYFPMFLWKVLDVFVYTIFGMLLSKLFVKREVRISNYLLLFLMLIYPYTDLSTAGWSTTTMTYLWPLVFGTYSLLSIKKTACGEKIRWYEYIFYIISLLYSISLEQMNLALMLVYTISFLYFLFQKKLPVFMGIQMLLTWLFLWLALTCPGNIRRALKEITQGFVDYPMLGTANKIEMGYSSTMYHLIVEKNLLSLILCIVIFITVLLKHKTIFYRMIAGFPLFLTTVFWLPKSILESVFPGMVKFANQLGTHGTITLINYDWKRSYIPVFLLGIAGCFLLLSLYLIYGNTKICYALILTLLAGAATRFIMGFSPTIWRSSERTYLILSFALIICIITVMQEMIRHSSKTLKGRSIWIIGMLAFLSYVDHLISSF